MDQPSRGGAGGEQRASARFPYPRPTIYSVISKVHPLPDARGVLRGDVVDLSSGGISIQTSGRFLEQAMVVYVWISVTDPPVRLPVLTEVRWIREARPGLYRAGLRFLVQQEALPWTERPGEMTS